MPKRTSKSGTGLLNALFPGEGDAADAVDAGGGGREEGEVGVPAAALQGDGHRPGMGFLNILRLFHTAFQPK